MSRYCKKCGVDSHVLESRTTNQNIRRRRACDRCGHRWTTMEIDKDEYKRFIKVEEQLEAMKSVMYI